MRMALPSIHVKDLPRYTHYLIDYHEQDNSSAVHNGCVVFNGANNILSTQGIPYIVYSRRLWNIFQLFIGFLTSLVSSISGYFQVLKYGDLVHRIFFRQPVHPVDDSYVGIIIHHALVIQILYIVPVIDVSAEGL